MKYPNRAVTLLQQSNTFWCYNFGYTIRIDNLPRENDMSCKIICDCTGMFNSISYMNSSPIPSQKSGLEPTYKVLGATKAIH